MRLHLEGYCPQPGRRGRTRHRVRVKGNRNKKITIPVGPDDEHFMEHYRAARLGVKWDAPEPEPEADAIKDSLQEAVNGYLAHLAKQVKQGTRSHLTLKQRVSVFKQAMEFKSPEGERIGDHERILPTEAIEYVRDEWGTRTAQADNCVKAFGALYTWMKVKPNPAKGVDTIHVNRGGAKAWTSDDLQKFIKVHRPGSMAYVWLMMAMLTAARRSDLAVLGRCHEVKRNGVIFLEFQPAKKGSAFVSIPVLPQLYEATRSPTVQGNTYLLNAHGRPFKSGDVLGMRVQRWTQEAGLSKRSSHGLRKALASLLAEVGCSNHQIMAVLAHTKASTSEVYTKSAERSRMALAAFEAIKHVKF